MFKTTTAKTPAEYIRMQPEPRRTDIAKLHALIRKTVPHLKPHIQIGMLGYGSYHYRYASGREGDWAIIGLANQKNYISLYVMAAEGGRYIAEKYKKELPKASIGKSCIRFRRLLDVDAAVLARLIKEGAQVMQKAGAQSAEAVRSARAK
ncbi:DUF1801 domain-containing protein [Candidatus Parcubacteria bacterium]|nr:MAG: DUF1801 domain-containing protein [Candidatus Parcubacteria bacterium]